jgi:hypothetical protein
LGATSSNTRGIFAGGSTSSSPSSVLEYVTIATTGNTTNFGNLSTVWYGMGACSNCSGGLQ